MHNDMNPSGPADDAVWDLAWSWASRRPQEGEAEDAALEELARWLAADAAHRQAYQKACRLWLLTGLVPPAHDVPIPGAPDSSDDTR